MRIATSDGVANDPVGMVPGDDTVVRRQFFKGGAIPDNWEIVEGSVEDDNRPPTGLGAAPHAYKHQIGEDGQVTDEHAPDAPEEEVAPTMRSSSKARSGGRGRRAASSE